MRSKASSRGHSASALVRATITVLASVRAATAACSLPTCSSLETRPGCCTLNLLGTTLSSISMAATPAASISCTVRLTLTALPKPSSASTIRLTSAIRVMRRQWSTTSDMLDSTISGTPRFAALPTEPDSTHTSYPSISAIRAERGSKIFAASTHVEPEMTLRNRSRARDIGASPLLPVVARHHYFHPVLDRQNRLGTLFRQLHVKGIEEEGGLGVVAHQGCQFRQMLGSELVQGRLERLLTDLVCLEKLRGVVDHCRFSRAHSWEGAALPQRVNQGIVYPGSASGRRMRVPDIGAVHRSGGGDNGQFLDVLGKSGLVPQVMGYMVASTSHLRAV